MLTKKKVAFFKDKKKSQITFSKNKKKNLIIFSSFILKDFFCKNFFKI